MASFGRSGSLVNAFMGRMPVPSVGGDSRMSDVISTASAGGQKRAFESGRDLIDSVMGSVGTKRRFSAADSSLGPFRSSLPASLAAALTSIDTGFSTEDAQTDQIMRQSLTIKPFAQRWEQDYVQMTPIFVSRIEPETYGRAFYSAFSPAVLNFGMELKAVRATVAAQTPALAAALKNDKWTLDKLMPTTGEEFDKMVNFMGAMDVSQDAGVFYSDATKRRGQGAERTITYSVYDRERIFNMFSPSMRRGEFIFFRVGEVDLSYLPNYLDPQGSAVAARRSNDTLRALQVVGGSSRHQHVAIRNSGYDPVTGPDSFTDPREGDVDYIARVTKLAKDFKYQEVDVDEVSGELIWHKFTREEADAISEAERSASQLTYEAYLEGAVKSVGYFRSSNGPAPSQDAILMGHRSHNAMKELQAITVYNVA